MPQDTLQQYFHTTGTTGRFLNEVFTQYEMQKSATQYGYSFWDHGVRAGDSIYFNFNFGMWIGLWSIYWGARNLGLLIYAGGGATSIERVRHILQHRPKIVVGTATCLLHLTEVAKAEGLDLRDAGVEIIAGGGEAGFSVPVTRQTLLAEWGATHCIDIYGIGENVVTSYTHFSQPFIKYRTHDLIRIDRAPDHGCGWTWQHLPGVVLGRADFMVTIRGTNIYPTAVENLIGGVAGLSNHYELHISRDGPFDQMLVRVESSGAGDPAALTQQLEAHFRTNLGVRLGVDVVAAGTLPRYELKSKRISDTRQAPGAKS